MAITDELLADAKDRMAKSVESSRGELATVRTGRASPHLLDRIVVDYYGAQTPLKQLANVSASVAGVLKPAGLQNAKDIISTAYLKDPTDPAWKDDPGVKTWQAFMDQYYPNGDKLDLNNIYGYAAAQTMVQVLMQCGDDLTRENIMKQAANLKNFSSDVMLPGIKINTSPDDFFPIEQMQLMKFDGAAWHLFGDVITGEVGHEASH